MQPEFHDMQEEYGRNLPDFQNELQAKVYYFDYRKEQLELMEEIFQYYGLKLDYSPNSLQEMEELYFQLFRHGGFYDLQISPEEFEKAMTVYFGEVVIFNTEDTFWAAKEYPFMEGKYTMALETGRYTAHSLNLFQDHYLSVRNEREQAVYREYTKWLKRAKKTLGE
ncbi:hypothetical protein GJU40_18610 [Bacillus lacus]|uniref:Uncharacterized protein n=1 Tax=Metabacillus lacus TaxID=1983721 RepID=A0A7X2M134_9BACI|nr:hypothetical protein [Metabacillus lacus]MRX74137.1 hypothetical protein [Metabacillus lacus]